MSEDMETLKKILDIAPLNRLEIRAVERAIDTLKSHLKDRWVLVSERLPNDIECNKFDTEHPSYRKFLCTIKIADYEPQVRQLFLSKVFGWKYGADDYNKYVVAWRPLPEPYKEKSNEG